MLDDVASNICQAVSLGLSGAEALEVRVRGLQLDDMNPRTAFPVLLWHSPAHGPLLRSFVTTAPLVTDATAAVAAAAARQGLTLVHFPAQRKRSLWIGGCTGGLFKGYL